MGKRRRGGPAHRNRGAGVPADRARGDRLSRRRGPDRLPGIVDSHAHLQHDAFDGDRDEVIARAVAAGVERILVPGWDVRSSDAALELAFRYPGVVHAAVGVHPHDAASADEAAWDRIERMAADPRCVAVGEIGLDYHRNLSPPDVQRDAFERQLQIAAGLDRPVLVHHRESHADVTRSLLEWRGRANSDARGILHAFSGDAAMARALADAGFLISFALPVAFRSAGGPRDAAAALPERALMVETDAPYLGPDRDRRNEPMTVLRVAAEVARLRGSDPESVARAARSAFARMADMA